jgi:hypothetical protein
MRSRPAALLLPALAASLCACVGYPRPYVVRRKGTASLENGAPVIKAAIVKECETEEGETERDRHSTQTKVDDKGRYSLTLIGMAWNWTNLVNGSRCGSRVQLYVCRDICRPADDVDINVLGK